MEATPLPFLHAIEALKHLPRTGWLRTIQNPETVAAHSFRVAILAMLAPVCWSPDVSVSVSLSVIDWPYQENLSLDRGKCIQMALVHDLAESVIGDIPTFAGVAKGKSSTSSHIIWDSVKLINTTHPGRTEIRYGTQWVPILGKLAPKL